LILFRHCDRRFPFLWESAGQPAARWHADGEGPAQYLADTPSGAWAEFLRHEGITDEADLAGVERALWAVDVDVDAIAFGVPKLRRRTQLGGIASYPRCQVEARRLRAAGAQGVRARSAALLPGGAGGWRVDGGEKDAPPRNGEVFVVFGRRPDFVGWPVVEAGHPSARLLPRVRQL
jgi:RES domain